jgi:ribonuclease HI
MKGPLKPPLILRKNKSMQTSNIYAVVLKVAATDNDSKPNAGTAACSSTQIQNQQTTEKTATVYTDSQTTLDSLKNSKIHTSLIENIRRKSMELEQAAWKLSFCWVKAHAGIQGNELADKLAKHAAGDLDTSVSYNQVPKSVVKREL